MQPRDDDDQLRTTDHTWRPVEVASTDSLLTKAFSAEHIVPPSSQSEPATVASGKKGKIDPVLQSLRVFGDYELVDEIARGGMGVVFKARHIKLNREAAVKMILAGQLASAMEVARFRTEAEAAANLDHPHILPLYEVGEHQGLNYFSMKFVGGGSLAHKISRSTLSPRAAAQIMEAVARAVHFAHQRGILHRDLKPGNILLEGDDYPYVTDFGLAKRIEGDSSITQSGAIVGTPSYMAPEQARADKVLTTAVDTYALGAILYELLAGKPPFKAATPLETVMQVLEREPEPPSHFQPGVPRDLETICLKCLAKEPHKRYGSAEALADDLRRYLNDMPILARPVGRLERSRRWCRRNPVVAAFSAAAVVGVVVAAVLLNNERSKTLENLRRAEGAERDLTQQLGITEKAERARAEQLWRSYRDQAEARRFSKQVGQRFESIKALAEAGRIARSLNMGEEVIQDLRRKAIACLALPDMRLVKELPGFTDGENDVTIDDTFKSYALRDRSCAISVRRVADGQEVLRLPGTGGKKEELWIFAFSPNGRYLAAAYNPGHELKVWDLDRKEVVVTDVNVDEGLDFSPDSRRVALGRKNGVFVVHDLPTGKILQSWQGPLGGCIGLWFRPDGKQFGAFNRRNNSIGFWEADTGRSLGILPQPEKIEQFAWNPGGTHLAVTYYSSSLIRLWDVPARKMVGLLNGHRDIGVEAHFHPADDLVMSNGWEGSVRLWDKKTGKQILDLPGISGRKTKFDVDGQRVLLRGKTLQIWEIADGREYRTFVSESFDSNQRLNPTGCSVSPDGRLLAAALNDGTRIWDMGTGKELVFLPTGLSNQTLFHPSGDLFTCGSNGAGVKRWPIRTASEREDVLRIGPPVTLLDGSISGMDQNKDGRLMAALYNNQGALILDPDHPEWAKPLLEHPGARYISVSHDGLWVATGTHHNSNVAKIWSARENKLVHEIPLTGAVIPVFSSDNRWLYPINASERRLWQVGSWELGPALPKRTGAFSTTEKAVFSPHSNLVYLTENLPTTIIAEMKTGRIVAALDDPNQDRPHALAISADGSQLVYTTWDSFSIHVWDLRRIRAELKMIDLDWNAADFPLPAKSDKIPIKMRLVLANPFEIVKQTERAQAMVKLLVNPFDAEAHLHYGAIDVETGNLESGHAHLMVALAFHADFAAVPSKRIVAAFRAAGQAFVRQQHWKEAADDFVQLTKLEPQDSTTWQRAAALYLVNEDRAGHRRLCKEMLEQFRNTSSPNEADRVIQAFYFAGEFPEDQDELAKLADLAVQRGQTQPADMPYFLFAHGLSDYRQGHFAAALDCFAEGRKARGVTPMSGVLAAKYGFFEAMALHQLGRAEEAKTLLANTSAAVQKGFSLVNAWTDWLFCKVALKEAEELLKRPPTMKP